MTMNTMTLSNSDYDTINSSNDCESPTKTKVQMGRSESEAQIVYNGKCSLGIFCPVFIRKEKFLRRCICLFKKIAIICSFFLTGNSTLFHYPSYLSLKYLNTNWGCD